MTDHLTQYPVLERRIRDNPWKTAVVGERRHRTVPEQPLPAGQRLRADMPSSTPYHITTFYEAARSSLSGSPARCTQAVE